MSYEGYTIEDDYLYIDFSETRENKKLINRVIEEAKEQRESISRAIESLQVPDSVLRGYGDELIPVKNSISKDINQLQRLNLHIDYVMRRFEEVDNEFAARFRTAGYELQETLGLERDSGIFEAFVGGLKLVVLQGVRAWSGFSKSIKDPAAQLEQHIKKWFKDDEQKADKTAIITMSVDRLHISNKNVLEETQGMYDYIKDGPTDKTWQLIAISQGWGIITYEEYCKRKSAQETNNQPYATGIGRMGPSKTTTAQGTGKDNPLDPNVLLDMSKLSSMSANDRVELASNIFNNFNSSNSTENVIVKALAVGTILTSEPQSITEKVNAALNFQFNFGTNNSDPEFAQAAADVFTVYATGKVLGGANSAAKRTGVEVNNKIIIDSANGIRNTGGETTVGHALQKHAGRNPDIWGKVSGNSQKINETANNILNNIIDAPGNFQKVTTKGIDFLEKKLPDGRGVRLNMDGTFKGFID